MVRHKPKGNETMTNETTQSLYVETLLATSRMFEFSSETHAEYNEDGTWSEICPTPTVHDFEERDQDWREEALSELGFDDSDMVVESDVIEHAQQIFEGDDNYHEWRDGFHPAMNYVWPLDSVENARHSEQGLADMVARAGCCVLVQIGDEYGIALTGGGMDLSDHIVRAYVNCGYMPPLCLIENAYAWGKLTDTERANVASRAKSFLSAQIGRIDQNATA